MAVEREMTSVDRFGDLIGAIRTLEASEPGRQALESLSGYGSCG